jgi:hypothetical protein
MVHWRVPLAIGTVSFGTDHHGAEVVFDVEEDLGVET